MIFMIDMVIHFKSVSNCTSEQLTRTFAVLVYLFSTFKIQTSIMIPHHSSLIKFLQIVPNLFKIIIISFLDNRKNVSVKKLLKTIEL